MSESRPGEPDDPDAKGRPTFRLAAPFAVHVFTASGAALGLLALVAAVRQDWPWMFLWLGFALVVDGVDGAIARRLNVAERLPRWSGDTLDLVVDFVTYVFVPAYAIAASGLMPPYIGNAVGAAVVISGALYFSDRAMKLPGNYFRGFPGLWNLAAFYLFLLRPGPWISALLVSGLVIMTFLPFPFVHPIRVRRLRPLSIALLAIWAVLALVTVLHDMKPGAWITAALCAIAVYFLVIGLFRDADE